MINIYKDKNILVFGLGINQGGVGAARFFAKRGANVKVTDLKTKDELKISLEQLKEFKNIKYTLGGHKNEDIDWADLIIKNPAVKPGNKFIYYAQKKKPVETDMGIFFQLVNRNQIIGITGTKGKTTTASLIYETLKISHLRGVILAGNIGKSVLDSFEFIDQETLVVLEISSFQMEGLIKHQTSPKYAVITNIYPDHLNYHPNMNAYIETKRMIAFYQKTGDFLFLNRDDQTLNNPEFIENLSSQIIFYSSLDLPETFKPALPGKHNKENYAAALAVCKVLEIPQDSALKAMNKFKGADFRLQTIKTWHGVKIINDSTATNPTATIEALKTLGPNVVLICGGMNKNMDYSDLASVIESHTKAVYFVEGDATEKLKCQMSNVKTTTEMSKLKNTYNNLETLLSYIKKIAKPGDTILFSPAATSFNLFQNEFDRGRKFNEAVKKVFKK